MVTAPLPFNAKEFVPAQLSNRLIDSLSPPVRAQLLGMVREVQLPVGTVLEEQDSIARHAYFMTSGIASVVVILQEGGTAEVALIGREGLAGSLALLGTSSAPAKCFMQVAGSGYKVALAELRALFLSSEEVRTQILKFVQQQTMTMSQIAACNKLHEAEPRIARWLLMVQDRLQNDTFSLTQEFLAEMLGTHRPTVSIVMGTLHRAGLIENTRGRITIISRADLEHAACDCYPVTKRLLSSLY